MPSTRERPSKSSPPVARDSSRLCNSRVAPSWRRGPTFSRVGVGVRVRVRVRVTVRVRVRVRVRVTGTG